MLLLTACGFNATAAVDDCRLRARAATGDYLANYELCLVERHHASHELASNLAGAEGAFVHATGSDDRTVRRASLDLEFSYLRLARYDGLDTIWMARKIRVDSTALYDLR